MEYKEKVKSFVPEFDNKLHISISKKITEIDKFETKIKRLKSTVVYLIKEHDE